MQFIEDPVAARRRIQRFLDRAARRDPYGELLASGQMSRRIGDSEKRDALRRELRRQARADKLKIITREYGDVVIALLNRPIAAEQEAEMLDGIRAAYDLADVAKRLGHHPRVASREHTEGLAYCTTCGELGHFEGSTSDLVVAGPLYTDPCPGS